MYHYGMIFQGFGARNQWGAPKMYLESSKYYLDTYRKVPGQTRDTQKRSSRFSVFTMNFSGCNVIFVDAKLILEYFTENMKLQDF